MDRSNAFTIDVEDGINIAMRDLFNVDISPTARVNTNTDRILDLLEESQVHATFFILGDVAKHYPELIRKISGKGHETGVHSYSHKQYFLLTPDELKQELVNTKALLEDLTGKAVYGHRAPAFSVMPSTAWALSVIAESGFIYDSSIMPARASHYGWPGTRKEIHRLVLPEGGSLVEVPLSVINFMGKTIPVCGGGYLKHFPYRFTRNAFQTIQRQRPVIVYLHPYEVDTVRYPDFFYEAAASAGFRKKLQISLYRVNKGTVERKLTNLLKEFHFKPLAEIVTDLDKNLAISDLHL